MSKLAFAFALCLLACGGNKPPPQRDPVPPASSADAPGAAEMSPEDCVAKGGEVRGDIGDGKIACAEGEQDLGRVRQGIEGSVCCARAAAK